MGLENQEALSTNNSLSNKEKKTFEELTPDEAGEALEGIHAEPMPKEIMAQAVANQRTLQTTRMQYFIENPDKLTTTTIEGNLVPQGKEGDVSHTIQKNMTQRQRLTYTSYVQANATLEGLKNSADGKTFVLDFSGSMKNSEIKALYEGVKSLAAQGIITPDTKISFIHGVDGITDYTQTSLQDTQNKIGLISYDEFLGKMDSLGYTNNGEWNEQNETRGTGSTPLLASIGEALLNSGNQVVVFGDGNSDLSEDSTGAVEHNYRQELQTMVDYMRITRQKLDIYLTNVDPESERMQILKEIYGKLKDQITINLINAGDKTDSIASSMNEFKKQTDAEQVSMQVTLPQMTDMEQTLPNISVEYSTASVDAGDESFVGKELPELTTDKVLTIKDGSLLITEEELDELFPGSNGEKVDINVLYGYEANVDLGYAESPKKVHISADFSGSMSENKEVLGAELLRIYGSDAMQQYIEFSGFSSGYETGQKELDRDDLENSVEKVSGNTPGIIALIDDAFDKMGDNRTVPLKRESKKDERGNYRLVNKKEQTEYIGKALTDKMSDMVVSLGGSPDIITGIIEHPEDSAIYVQKIIDLLQKEENINHPTVLSLQANAGQKSVLVSDGQFNALNVGSRSASSMAVRGLLRALFTIQDAYNMPTTFVDVEGDQSNARTPASKFIHDVIVDNGGTYRLVGSDESMKDVVNQEITRGVIETQKEELDIRVRPPVRAEITRGGVTQILQLRNE